MDLEVVAGGHDGMLVGCSIDLLQDPEHQVLRKKYHEKSHDGIIRCVASGGRYLASGGTDETLQLYDMRRHVNVGSLLHHEASITCLYFHKERHLLSASEDGMICVWSCGRKWEHVFTLAGHKYSVTSLAVHPSGKLALSVGKDRTLRTWDLTKGRMAFTLRLPKAADLVEWSPIGDHYVVAVGASVMVHSIESGECVAVIEASQQINSLVFVQDSVLAVGGAGPNILLFSTSTGHLLTTLSGHTNRVKGLAVSPDYRLLFSVSSDGTMRAWTLPKSLEDSKCVSTLELGSRLTCVSALLPEKLSEGEGGGRGGREVMSAAKDIDKVISGEEMSGQVEELGTSGQTSSELESGQEGSGQNRKAVSGHKQSGQNSKAKSGREKSGQNSKEKSGHQVAEVKSQQQDARKSGHLVSRQSSKIKKSGRGTLKSGQVASRKTSKAKSGRKDAQKFRQRSEVVRSAAERSKDKVSLPPGKSSEPGLPKKGKKRKLETKEDERTVKKKIGKSKNFLKQ